MKHADSESGTRSQQSVEQTVLTLRESLRTLPPEVSDSVRQHLAGLIEAGEALLARQEGDSSPDPNVR